MRVRLGGFSAPTVGSITAALFLVLRGLDWVWSLPLASAGDVGSAGREGWSVVVTRLSALGRLFGFGTLSGLGRLSGLGARPLGDGRRGSGLVLCSGVAATAVLVFGS